MKHRTLQWSSSSLLALAFCVAALAPMRASAGERCEEVRAWVLQNANRLPTTYEAYIQYPEEYRRAMLEVLSPEVKSAIWTRHLELYLAERPWLTPEQVEVVQQAILLATPRSFAPGQVAATRVALIDLREKGAQVFDKAELARILVHLGSSTPKGDGPIIMQPQCNCSDDWDCGGTFCGGSRCSLTYGCGPFGMDHCYGFCTF